MTRRTLLIAIGIAAAAAAVYVAWPRAGVPAVAPGPPVARTRDQNVLLITIDTLRGDALGSYGGRAATPHLDALAKDGVRFTFAHAHSVVTLSSHTTILTGRYPFDHGVRDNAGYRAPESVETLAEVAKGAGLATGAFVGAFPLDRRFGLNQGFDVYDDVGGLGKAEADFSMSERRAEAVVAAARTWIGEQSAAGRPWFAWVHVFDPHAGYAPPPPFDQQYADNLYAGEVAYVDHALGPLLADARGGTKPTTVVVTSDHGEGLGEHGEATHGTFAYESTLRVPLIVAQLSNGRAHGEAGQVSDFPAAHVDIFPTITDALGLALDDATPGYALLPQLSGAMSRHEVRTLYFEAMSPMLTHGWAPLRGVLVETKKYIDLPIEELYDLMADPREQTNIAAASAADTRARAKALAGLNAPLPGAQRDENAEARRRLESLGYVSRGGPRKARFTEDDDPKRLIALDRMMIEGLTHYSQGRQAEAVATFRGILARRPDMRLAYRQLAFIQWEHGDPSDAIATLREGLSKAGRDPEIEVRLATYLTESGALAEGLPMLERTVQADPGNIDALNALGIAYARAGRSADALDAFARVIAADPRNVHAHENIGTVHLGGDMRAAAAAFTRALELSPSSSRAQAGLGVVALDAGRRDEAIARWRRAVELDPRNFDALFNLATELLNAGRPAEARPYVDQFVRTAPRAFYARDIDRLRTLVNR